jgi:hypothetical protein
MQSDPYQTHVVDFFKKRHLLRAHLPSAELNGHFAVSASKRKGRFLKSIGDEADHPELALEQGQRK